MYNVIAIGDVAGTGVNTNRIYAKVHSSRGDRIYAYRGQQVAGLTENESGNASSGLLSGAALGVTDTWTDVIRLGAAWNYSPVNRDCLPVLKHDCSREDWTQKEIPLPGQSDDPTMSVESAVYDNNNGKYVLTARLTHPKVSGEYIQTHLKVNLDGMDISEAAIAAERSEIKIEPVTGKEETLLRITTDHFVKAFDSYMLTLNYTEENGRNRELTCMVQYREADETGELHKNYWEIPDIRKWNEIMAAHGKTSENILITGMIDFGGGTTAINELEINRLEGKDKNCGFKNLIYVSGAAGNPWINKIGQNM